MAGGGLTTLNSLPKHYGYMAALWAGLPAFLLFVVWLALESSILQNMIVSGLPAEVQALSDSELGLYYNQLVGYAQGSVDISRVSEAQVAAAAEYQELAANSKLMKLLLVGSLALLGGLLATIRVSPELRARSHVENIFKWILFTCSFIAVLTTLGIVLSVLFEAIRFFQVITISDFLLGLQWESADGYSSRPGWCFRILWICAPVSWHFAYFLRSHAYRGSHWSDVRHLSL